MNYPKKELFYQVKSSHMRHGNAMNLFDLFKLSQVLKKCNIVKEKGHNIIDIFYQILLSKSA